MTTLFEKLFEILAACWVRLVFWHILGDDQCGLIRRLGCYHRDLTQGWNWKWPLVEEALAETSALDSAVLREQTLTTRDGKQVTLRGVLTYRVVDARKYILGVDGPESVINDVGAAVISEVVPLCTLQEVLEQEEFNEKLFQQVKKRARKWGVAVDSFGLIDRVATRTYRFIGVSPNHGHGWS